MFKDLRFVREHDGNWLLGMWEDQEITENCAEKCDLLSGNSNPYEAYCFQFLVVGNLLRNWKL